MAKLKKSDGASEQTAQSRPSGMVEVRTPSLAKPQQKQRSPPRLEESCAFLFTHSPERYVVVDGRLIPELGKFKLQGGVNGMEVHPKTGELRPQLAIDEALAKGITIIPEDVDGEGTTYLRSPEGAPHAVLTKWDRTYSGSSQVDTDKKAYADWCLSLIDRGILQPPPVYVIEKMIAATDRELEQIGDNKQHDRLNKILTRNRIALSASLEAAMSAEQTFEEASP